MRKLFCLLLTALLLLPLSAPAEGTYRIVLDDAVAQAYEINVENDYQVERVSASVGRDLTKAAFTASLVAVALILVYIAFRFEFKSGVAAVCALIHDLLVMLSFYVIFRIPFNINFIAAALARSIGVSPFVVRNSLI